MAKNPVIDPPDSLYNSRIPAAYLRFLRKEYSHVDIDDLLSYAGMEAYQVEDEDHWFTQEQADRFNERVIELTGNPDIDREAGRFGLSADSIGFLRSYILGHMSIGKAYETIAQISQKFVKSDTFESARLASNKVRIVVTPRPGAQEKPYQCQSRIGYFEALGALFHHKFPHVEHTRCLFRGDECCEYVVTWREYRHEFWRKTRTFGGAAFLSAASFLFLRSTVAGLFGLLTALTGLMFFSSWVGKLQREEIYAGIDNLSRSTNDVIKKMETSDNNARMTQEIGHILTEQETVAGVLHEVTRILEKRLDYDKGIILIADKNRRILEAKDRFGHPKELEVLNNGILGFDASDMLLVRCFREQKPFLVNNSDELPETLGVNTEIVRKLGITSFLCCPIGCAEEAMGVLAVGNMKMKRVLLQSDLDLLMLVAQEMAVTMQNLMLKQAEKALRESEALFRAVVEKSSEVLVLTNSDGNIFYVSPPVTEGFGYGPLELMGTEWRRLVHREDSRAVQEARVWVHKNRAKAKHVTARIRHKDGRWRWVDITMRDLLWEPGVGAVVSNLRDVTDRTAAQQALLESENKFRDLVEKAMVGVYLVQRGVFRYVNAKFADMHGYDDPQMMHGLDVSETIFPEDLPPIERTDEWIRGEDTSHGRRFRIVRRDGETRYVAAYGCYTTYQGEPAVIGMTIDVTDRRNAEEALRWKTTFLEALVDSSRDGILIVDNRMQKVMQNEKLVQMWQMPQHIAETEDEEQRIKFLMASIKDPREFYKKLMHLYKDADEVIHSEFELNSGTVIDTFSYPVTGKDEQYGRIWTFRDITEVRRYWDMLENLSATDGLTGLSNRRRFDAFLELEWRRSMRERTELSLILMDIDYFKQFNDLYGHLSGDDCLKQVAAALKRTIRRAGDLVARYGGEEFACVLPGAGKKKAGIIAQRIADRITGLRIRHEGSEVADHITLSYGVATVVPERELEYSDLIRIADRSLYSAKRGGRNRIVALPDKYDRVGNDERQNSA